MVEELQDVLAEYDAAMRLTEKQKKLARDLRQFYETQFTVSNQKCQMTSRNIPTEHVARLAAEVIGKSFSSAQFLVLFQSARLSEGWAMDDALAAWYSLGNLALVISVRTSCGQANAPTMINRCRRVLRKYWNMPEELFEKMLAIVKDTEASAVAAFAGCKDGSSLATFFARYVSRILGAPVRFSERTKLEDEMRGIRYRNDIALEAAVCQLFIVVCTAAKELLAAAADA